MSEEARDSNRRPTGDERASPEVVEQETRDPDEDDPEQQLDGFGTVDTTLKTSVRDDEEDEANLGENDESSVTALDKRRPPLRIVIDGDDEEAKAEDFDLYRDDDGDSNESGGPQNSAQAPQDAGYDTELEPKLSDFGLAFDGGRTADGGDGKPGHTGGDTHHESWVPDPHRIEGTLEFFSPELLEFHAGVFDIDAARAAARTALASQTTGTTSSVGPELSRPQRRPEELTIADLIGKPADVWALGVLAFTCLHGKFPFAPSGYESKEDVFRNIMFGLQGIAPEVWTSLMPPIARVVKVGGAGLLKLYWTPVTCFFHARAHTHTY